MLTHIGNGFHDRGVRRFVFFWLNSSRLGLEKLVDPVQDMEF